MRKRITSLLLTLAMLCSLLPAMGVTASAAEWTTVNTYDDLKAALSNQNPPDNIKLGNDIDTGTLNSGMGILEPLEVKGKKQLDLNGHTLRLFTQKSALGDLIEIKNSSLTLSDSSTDKTGRILGVTKGDADVLINVWENGKFTMNSGKLEVEVYTGSIRGVLWRRTIDCHYGGEVVINGGTLYVPPKTYEDSNAYTTQFFDEFDDLHNGSCGYTLITNNDSKVTINGGTFQGPVRMNAGNSKWNGMTSRVIITGGTFEKDVVLNGAGSTTGNGKVTLAEIKGGTFHGKVQAWAAASFDSSFSTPEVVISGGEFSKEFWLRPKFPLVNNKEQRGVAYQVAAKLNGGTFHEGFSADKNYENYEYSASAVKQRLEAYEIYQLADKLLGQNAIQTGNGTFAAQDNNSYNKYITNYRKSEHDSGGYAFIIKAVNNQPTKIIPNAWGMESVTLDGTKINYAKDWKGAVEEMDNSTAHTIKFTWKPLASELVNAGYSYRAECDRYISGNKTPTTDTISATATEYSFTIPAGADPKVYSFALHLNLKKGDNNIGIISNEHIVKLVVNQAPVVKPDPTLAGNVYYTSGIVYGRSISTGTSNLPTDGFDSSKLRYQWQRRTDGGKWTDIEGANKGSYTPVPADMGENVFIRVKITANGYLGEIIGAAVKVSKAANNNYPEVIELEAVKDGTGNYTGFKITNFDSDCEYVYNTTDTPNWSTNQISSATVTSLTSDTTYYVFARFKETATHTAGSIVSSNSIKLFDYVPLDRVLLEGYGSSGTIYIKKGESVTLKVNADPSNANSWKEITFKDEGATTSNIAISNGKINASTGTAKPFPNGHTITITGVSKGSANLRASYPSATSSAYGTWYVVVYDDSTVANALRLESVYAYEDITLSENDTAELPTTNLLKLLPENSGYHLEWRILKKAGYSGNTYVTENENIKLENGKIIPIKAHTGSEKAQLELVAVKDGSDTYKTLPKKSIFYVTVTEAPIIELTSVIVAPTKVNLAKVGATCQLSAVKEPVNAPDSLNWESSNTGVATVDGTGKVTAVAAGTATIKVTCGGKEATCTVTVAHTHDTDKQSWASLNDYEHYRSCTAGDETKFEPHSITSWTDNGDGTHTGTCTDCGYVKTEISATGGGSSSGGGSSGGGGGAGVTTYVITVQNSKNGAVTASHKSAAKDTAVTLTVTPDKGYVLDTLTVLDSKNKAVKLTEKNGKYTFTMPSSKVTVSAAFKAAAPASENPFTDVPSGAYYEDAVIWAVKKGITSGTSATTFDPDGSCTRAQAVTFLWRAAGSPEPKSAAMPFTDVPAGSYFEKAVLWAVENGITKGTSDTTFSPDASCTRAQIVTFLWRAGGSPAVSGNSAFSDVAADAYYAAAVAWAEKNGVTGGIGGGLFGSDNTCTRAQIVTFLHRAMK